MKDFAALFMQLDATVSTEGKVQALVGYLARADAADAAWAVYFLAGGKPRQVVPVGVLVAAACEEAGLPPWLFDASYQAVGDLAETIAHILPPPAPATAHAARGLAEWVEQRLLPLRGQPPEQVLPLVRAWWRELDTTGRFLLTKLVGGGFRVGVSRQLVQRALARHAGIEPTLVAQRMMGYTDARKAPTPDRYAQLVAPAPPPGERLIGGQPYPFFLAHPLATELPSATGLAPTLGDLRDWQVEWKWDGLRAQIVRREGQLWIWSRGEELLTERFPELHRGMQQLPDGTVLDGEILAWDAAGPDGGRPAPFTLLQTRINRKTVTPRLLREAPVRFLAYDLLESAGQDLRDQPQDQRRARLEALLAGGTQAQSLGLSPLLAPATWEDCEPLRAQARAEGVEGLMLKHRSSRYGVGRTRTAGIWWKWKLDPMTVDAVLVYAQAGHGRRASLYTDYTFAVWSRPPASAQEVQEVLAAIAQRQPPQPGQLQLVPFAKAYSGLTDEAFKQVDAIIRRTTLQKFGPVRAVQPTLIFELGFEGIGRSPRHRSGVAVRFPRMLRWRDDKPLHEAGTLQELEYLIGTHSARG